MVAPAPAGASTGTFHTPSQTKSITYPKSHPPPENTCLQCPRSASATPARIAGEAEPVIAGHAVMQADPAGLRRKWFSSRLKDGGACVCRTQHGMESSPEPSNRPPRAHIPCRCRRTGVAWKNTPNGARRVSILTTQFEAHDVSRPNSKILKIAKGGVCHYDKPMPPAPNPTRDRRGG